MLAAVGAVSIALNNSLILYIEEPYITNVINLFYMPQRWQYGRARGAIAPKQSMMLPSVGSLRNLSNYCEHNSANIAPNVIGRPVSRGATRFLFKDQSFEFFQIRAIQIGG